MKGFVKVVVFGVIAMAVFLYFYDKSNRAGTPERSSTATRGATRSPSEPIGPRLEAIAARVGVRLSQIEESPGEVRLQVEWMGNQVMGGDFIQAVSDAGLIRDFEDTAKPRAWADSDGRRHYVQSLLLKLR